MKLEVRKIGNSFGVILPKQLIVNLHIKEGDALYAVNDEKGGVNLTPYDPEFEKAMDAYHKFSKHNKNALRELSKK